MKRKREQSFKDWVYNPSKDDELISNRFRKVVKYAFDYKLSINTLDVNAPDINSLEWKLATLLYHKRITPEGNKVYVYRNGNLSPLPDGMEDLQYLLHESEKNTAKAYSILSHELNGVVRNLVERDTVGIIDVQEDLFGAKQETRCRINLREMKMTDGESPLMIPEFGWHYLDVDRVGILLKFFEEQNKAFGTEEEYFFEKAISYSFHQKFREKAFICNGPGGVGKTLMTRVAEILYDSKGVVASEPTFTGQDKNRITRAFIGKKMVIYVDIEEPSVQLMTWLKPMATGNMTIKGEGGYERSVPCEAVFYLETNFKPQFLGGNQDIRRFVVRSAEPGYKLIEHMTDKELDVIGREITPADIAWMLMTVDYAIRETAGGWCHFEDRPLPIADFIEIAQEYFSTFPGKITKGVVTAYATQNKLSRIELETLKEVLLIEQEEVDKKKRSRSSKEELLEESTVLDEEAGLDSTIENSTGREDVLSVPMPSVPSMASDEEGVLNGIEDASEKVLDSLPILLPADTGEEASRQDTEAGTVSQVSEPGIVKQPSERDEEYLSDF